MTGLILGRVVPALDAPEPTATKLGRQWGSGIDWDAPARDETATVPGLSKAAIVAEYGPETAYAPRWRTASFRVPYGMREHQLEALVREQAGRWFEWSHRRGFDVVNGDAIDVRPGPNPSRDLQTGLVMPGYRDFLLRAQFVERHPEVIRLELPGDLFEATAVGQLPRSSGDEGAD